MKKNICCIIVLACLHGMINAQQVSSTGGYTTKSEITVDWVLGGSLSDVAIDNDNEFKVVFNDQVKSSGVSLKVFPVPAKEILNLEITPSDTGRIVVALYNITGGKVLSREYSSKHIIQINVADIPSGIYFLKVYNAGSNKPSWIEKIIKE